MAFQNIFWQQGKKRECIVFMYDSGRGKIGSDRGSSFLKGGGGRGRMSV